MEGFFKILFRLVLASVAIAHLIIGAIAYIPGMPVVKMAEVFYKATVTLTPEMGHIIQMFGAYMLAIGIIALFAVWNPVKNKAITYGIIILLILRVLQRIVFAKDAWTIFHIPSGWYWIQTISFFVIATVLFFLYPRVKE